MTNNNHTSLSFKNEALIKSLLSKKIHIVSDTLISTLVETAFYVSSPDSGKTSSLLFTKQELGQIFVNANFNSVNYRYNSKEKSYQYTHNASQFVIPNDNAAKIKLIAMCDYYDYQSCEVPYNYQHTLAGEIIQEIRKRLIHGLKGYDLDFIKKGDQL